MSENVYLSPSRIARHFYHNCERFLVFDGAGEEFKKKYAIPNREERNIVTQAMFQMGFDWEEKVAGSLENVYIPADPGDKPKISERSFGFEESLKLLGQCQPGEYIYQATFEAPKSFLKKYDVRNEAVVWTPCKPDLIEVVEIEGEKVFRIIDVKATDQLKISHKAQTIIYSLMLESILEDNNIGGRVDWDKMGIWLYETGEPEYFNPSVIRPILEGFLREDLADIFSKNPLDCDWHTHYRCEWCGFYEHCLKEAKDSQSVSLIPYMTPGTKNFLKAQDVVSLKDMKGFLSQDGVDEILEGNASLKGKKKRYVNITETLMDQEIREFGGSSLSLPVGENIRIFITVQKDPVSGKIYCVGLYISGKKDDKKNLMKVWVAKTPDESESIQIEFIEVLYDYLEKLSHENKNKEWNDQMSVQSYVFDSYDWTLLRQVLMDGLQVADIAEKALGLMFYFHSENLLQSEDHSFEPPSTHFPVVVLTSSIRSLFSVSIAVAYNLEDVLSELNRGSDNGFQYKANPYFSFKLSNALKADAIHAIWYQDKKDMIEAIQSEVQKRLWGAQATIFAIRQKAGNSLYCWPPKFQLPDIKEFQSPILSKLSFIARYESILTYLEIKGGRVLPMDEKIAFGIAVPLTYRYSRDGLEYFRVDLESQGSHIFFEDIKEGILSEDNEVGDKAQKSFSDFTWKPFFENPPSKYPMYFVEKKGIIENSEENLIGFQTFKAKSSVAELIQNKKYVYHPRFRDWNSNRVIDRLVMIDEEIDQYKSLIDLISVADYAIKPFENKVLESTTHEPVNQARLTQSQARAFYHSVKSPLTLVWGPPGTGKTHFLALSILIYIETMRRLKKPFKVLISGFTHASIENCMGKIQELQKETQIVGEKLQMFKLDQAKMQNSQSLDFINKENCQEYLDKHDRVILGGSTFSMLKAFQKNPKRPFDLVVLDEGSQVKVGESLLPLSRTSPKGRMIIAGDDKQLAPIIKGDYPDAKEKDAFLHKSIFENLRTLDSKGQHLCQLNENFRMNKILSDFPAKAIYSQQYRPYNEVIANRRIQLKDFRHSDEFINIVLDPSYPLVLCSLDGVSTGAINPFEAEKVAELSAILRDTLLINNKLFPKNEAGDREFWKNGLFIVSPHHNQIREIKKELKNRGLDDPFVDTVDKMQGQECEVVIVSYGVSDPEYAMSESDFIYSLNRLNVAITRAKAKCIVFLSRSLLNPTLEVMENQKAAEGISYMKDLEWYIMEKSNGHVINDKVNQVKWMIYKL